MEQPIYNSITIIALKDFNCSKEVGLFTFDDITFIKGLDNLDAEHFYDYNINLIGQLNLMNFSNRFYAVCKKEVHNLEELGILHLRIKSKATHFINCLWFSKDNSASILNVYTFSLNSNHSLQSTIGPGNSSSSANNKKVEFEEKDFDLALEIYKSIAANQSNIEAEPLKIDFNGTPIFTDSKYHKTNQSKTNRIDRALCFLFIARQHTFLPLKISLYISVLECLFTKDSGEVVHKISERTAFYIGETPDERLDLFRSVKKAYGVRSKFFHGQPLEKNSGEHNVLQAVSENLDEILRKVLNKVMLIDSAQFLLNDTKLEEFYQHLIFKNH